MGLFNGQVQAGNPLGLDLEAAVTPAEKAAGIKLVVTKSPGFDVPNHYLKKMTRYEINSWTRLFWINQMEKCPRNQGVDTNNCVLGAIGLAALENANLAFINGLATYDHLKWTYDEVEKANASLPSNPIRNIKEQMRANGKFIAGGVAGFITSGPVGMFTGAATAVGKLIAEDRAKKAAADAAVMASQAGNVNAAIASKQYRDAEEARAASNATLIKYSLYAGIGLAVAGGLYFVLSD